MRSPVVHGRFRLLAVHLPFSSPPCRVPTPLPPTRPRDTTREENGMSVTRSEPKWATSEASGSITFQPYRPSSFPLLIPFPSRPVRGAEGRSPGRTTMGRERERWATCHYGRMSVSCLCLSSNRFLCSLRSWACHSPPFTSVLRTGSAEWTEWMTCEGSERR